MRESLPGLYEMSDSDIPVLIFVDTENHAREEVWSIDTWDGVKAQLESYEIYTEATIDMIKNRSTGIHTFLFDVVTYRKHLEETARK